MTSTAVKLVPKSTLQRVTQYLESCLKTFSSPDSVLHADLCLALTLDSVLDKAVHMQLIFNPTEQPQMI